MAFTIKIAGVDRTSKCWCEEASLSPSGHYARPVGGVGIFEFKTYDIDGSAAGYRPAIGQVVEVFDGASLILEGEITDIADDPLTDRDSGVICSVTVEDYHHFAVDATYTVDYTTAKTLEQILDDLVLNCLSAFGITVDVAQPTGPTFEPRKYDNAQVSAILNDLQTASAAYGAPYVWSVSPTLVLSMVQAGATSVGFALGDAVGEVIGPVRYRHSRAANFANRVTVLCGEPGQHEVTQVIPLLTGVTQYQLDIPFSAHRGYVTVTRGGSPSMETIGQVFGDGSGWVLLQSISLPSGGGLFESEYFIASNASSFVTGDSLSITYTARFPFPVTVKNDASITALGYVIDRTFEVGDITRKAAGIQMAEALLARGLAQPKESTLHHREGLAHLGRSLALTFTSRNLTGTFTVVGSSWHLAEDGEIDYEIDTAEGDILQPTWADHFRTGGGASSTSGATSGNVTAGATSSQMGLKMSGQFSTDVSANNNASLGNTPAIGSLPDGPGVWLRTEFSQWAIVADEASLEDGARGLLFQDRQETSVPWVMTLDRRLPGDASPGYRLALNAIVAQSAGEFLYPGSASGLTDYQTSHYLASHATYGLYTASGLGITSWLNMLTPGVGIYNQDTQCAFASESTSYWGLECGLGLRFYATTGGSFGSFKGAVYHGGTANFGLLASDGNWFVYGDAVHCYIGGAFTTRVTNGLTQNTGNAIYPGSASGLTAYQTSFYLASHATWGLFTNTSLYATSGFYSGDGWFYSTVNGGGLRVRNAANNAYLTIVGADAANATYLDLRNLPLRIIGAVGGIVNPPTGGTRVGSIKLGVDGIGTCYIPVYS